MLGKKEKQNKFGKVIFCWVEEVWQRRETKSLNNVHHANTY